MYKKILFITLATLPLILSAQMGNTMKKIVSYIGEDQIMNTKREGNFISQDIMIGKKEIAMFTYNKDSVAVMVGFSRKDSIYYLREVMEFRKNNIPTYKANIKCMLGTTTFHWDTVHQILLMINYDLDPIDPHITGFAATVDPALIKMWTADKTGWIKE